MELPTRKFVYMLLCTWAAFTASFPLVSSSLTCQLEFKTFLHDFNSQCPFVIPFSFPPIQVDGESFESVVSYCQKNEYVAVLFHSPWCPFSSVYRSKFSTLSSMYPQIRHLMVDQSSAMPRYGIHSVPSLLIVNQKTRTRYYGQKDFESLVNFYRKTTGLDPIVDMVEDTPSNLEDQTMFQNRASLKGKILRESYLVFSAIFVLSRALLYFFPDIASHVMAM